jgi:hypothetical protein
MQIQLWLENLKGRDYSKDVGIDGRIILDSSHRSRVKICRLDSSGSGQGPVSGSCEHGKETSGYMKGGEFLD